MLIIDRADLVLVVAEVVVEQVEVVVPLMITLILGASRSHRREGCSQCK